MSSERWQREFKLVVTWAVWRTKERHPLKWLTNFSPVTGSSTSSYGTAGHRSKLQAALMGSSRDQQICWTTACVPVKAPGGGLISFIDGYITDECPRRYYTASSSHHKPLLGSHFCHQRRGGQGSDHQAPCRPPHCAVPHSTRGQWWHSQAPLEATHVLRNFLEVNIKEVKIVRVTPLLYKQSWWLYQGPSQCLVTIMKKKKDVRSVDREWVK